ncbi:hypothetical protein TTHERM_01310170 (macronuclear) [Tetrahymena thermophila SB210]|uniref:Uncharacterized protein n=1 Tax=Tetrahymena thermophila (strain SB210) TaxID=312017 RepID=Q24F91_TETTS|nr:hypothetical protein TTHERM_01310170 [Tetrahymena thermophila SB210]EAS06433.2 hypothetical protein TTHERM_01310170 [Tetrahymena thermophila SB210]|eukprot:XP_001026678.2 hypothetical protein TTHERM_01310170 [Tetrahymena thermophila SB210]
MFRQAFKFGGRAFMKLANKKAIQIGTSLIGIGLYQRYNVMNEQKQNLSSNDTNAQMKNQSQQENKVKVEEDAIYLNKQTYMQNLLGNKHENYILIVHAEDNYEDTNNSIKAAKHIKKIIKQQRDDLKSNVDINVYVVSRPTLEEVKKLANRVMDFKIFEREEDPQPIEVYIKTVHSNESVYIKWRRESFYSEYKSNKFVKKLDRYLSLFDRFQNTNNIDQLQQQEKILADILQKQYIKMNEPVIIKCASLSNQQNSVAAKQQHKELKFFKKLCFMSLERKLIPLKSRFVILENKEIMRQLNLEDGQIYILRNDMVQKLENSKDISEVNDKKKKIVINDEFMYLKNERNLNGKNEKLQYFSSLLENYQGYKHSNQQLIKSIETLSKETGKAQNAQELEEMKEEAAFVNFIMPRITFLRDAKFGSIGKLFRKITFQKEKHVLSLNLQNDDKTYNNSRILTFKKLYEQYKNEFTFLLVDTDELVDLFPHMESNQPQFSVFNFFNIDKSLSKVGKYYKHLIFPFEKYFLRDSENFYEDFSTLQKQVDQILLSQGKQEYVVNQQDMIQNINSETLDHLLQNSIHPFLVQIFDDSPQSRLSQLTLNQLELNRLSQEQNSQETTYSNIKFYRMSHLNQHPFLKGRDESDQKGPLYLLVDPSTKRVYLSPIKEQFSKVISNDEAIQFLQQYKKSDKGAVKSEEKVNINKQQADQIENKTNDQFVFSQPSQVQKNNNEILMQEQIQIQLTNQASQLAQQLQNNQVLQNRIQLEQDNNQIQLKPNNPQDQNDKDVITQQAGQHLQDQNQIAINNQINQQEIQIDNDSNNIQTQQQQDQQIKSLELQQLTKAAETTQDYIQSNEFSQTNQDNQQNNSTVNQQNTNQNQNGNMNTDSNNTHESQNLNSQDGQNQQ